MKILLACVGGLSTSILMKKLRKYGEEKGEEIIVDAKAKDAIGAQWKDYDCILIGPQISYCLDELKETVDIPVAAIPSMDYGIGNAENVMKLAHEITGK